ncbi:MAG: hypothetical protein Ctma_0218 [Catillopecten margaritatus gill symbiont]|uniref:Uncharacterized protein n=1 Tax=Catillopecten margaritatus gill symbiont TaxID=3083288 RepID=A0AAU6PES1_9GAMM
MSLSLTALRPYLFGHVNEMIKICKKVIWRLVKLLDWSYNDIHEIGRIKHNLDTIIRTLKKDFEFKEVNSDNALITNFAVNINWVCDVFDRLIVTSAMADDAKFITKNKTILMNFNQVAWQ